VRYRVFKIADVQGDKVSITVDVKQYAINDKVALPELGQQLEGLHARAIPDPRQSRPRVLRQVMCSRAQPASSSRRQLGFGTQGKAGSSRPNRCAESAPHLRRDWPTNRDPVDRVDRVVPDLADLRAVLPTMSLNRLIFSPSDEARPPARSTASLERPPRRGCVPPLRPRAFRPRGRLPAVRASEKRREIRSLGRRECSRERERVGT